MLRKMLLILPTLHNIMECSTHKSLGKHLLLVIFNNKLIKKKAEVFLPELKFPAS